MAWAAAIIGGGLSYAGNKKAGDEASKGGTAALAESSRQFDTARADLAPWRASGGAALDQLSQALGLEGYRTKEEIALREFQAGAKPGLGFTPTKPNAKEAFLNQNWDIRNAEKVTGIGGLSQLKKSRRHKDRQAMAAAQAKLEQEQSAYDAKLKELTAARDASLVGYDPAAATLKQLQTDPGYNFRLAEGEKGLNRSIAAKTGVLQPGAAKELSKYNSDYASNEYGNYINRLAGVAGVGQSAATNQAGLAAAQGGQNANIMLNMGSQKAGAINNAYGGLNNAIQGGASNYYTMSMYDKLLKNNAGNSNFNMTSTPAYSTPAPTYGTDYGE